MLDRAATLKAQFYITYLPLERGIYLFPPFQTLDNAQPGFQLVFSI